MRGVAKYLAIALLLLVVGGEASAQKMKERRCVRQGNAYFEEGKIDRSIESYQEALKHDPNSFEAKFDLASALYRAERYDAAEKGLQALLNNDSLSEAERGDVAYNLGNVQFAQKKYKEALDFYRKAMRYNPTDEDAKFNYALTKLKLQQQEQQQQNQQQNQDNQQDNQGKNDQQNQQNNQDNKDKQDKQNEDKKDDKNQDQQPQNQNGNEDKQQGGQRPQGGMSPEQQEALLQAVQAEEDKTQDKLKEKGAILIRGNKNW